MTGNVPQVAIITGGSRGIGAACALILGQAGYSVVVNYANNQKAANDIVKTITASGGTAMAIKGDVGSEADILNLFNETDAAFGQVTALVNNAGIVDITTNVADMTAVRLERMMRINVTGSILCAREAVRRMAFSRGGKGGAIVNISSVAASLGSPGQYVDYAASKGAIDTFTIGLAKEVATDGIRVNGVRPGIINTDIHASGGIPDRAEKLKNQIPMKRPGTAEEVANAVVYLLSHKASYSTGALLDVGGGR
ncbi:MAG: SDR family oxidoreductase [Hyphomicrobiales bacterium]